jgi:hypothetical protein
LNPAILRPEVRWECPNCPVTDVTHTAEPHTRFHTCAGLRGLNAPMVRVGVIARVRTVEREDYVGSQMVQTDGNGRPVMAIVTDREDGQDCAILAPCVSSTVDAKRD